MGHETVREEAAAWAAAPERESVKKQDTERAVDKRKTCVSKIIHVKMDGRHVCHAMQPEGVKVNGASENEM